MEILFQTERTFFFEKENPYEKLPDSTYIQMWFFYYCRKFYFSILTKDYLELPDIFIQFMIVSMEIKPESGIKVDVIMTSGIKPIY